MSYLLDKRLQRKKFVKILVLTVVLLVLIYFHSPIFNRLSSATHIILRPMLVAGGGISEKFSNLSVYFKFKSTLQQENENLKSQLGEVWAKVANYNSVLDENSKLKDILGRKNEKTNLVLASILSKPNQTPYDTIIIDAGQKQGIREGGLVLASGFVPIGLVSLAYPDSSKVILFSNPGEKTEIVIAGRDVFMQLVGRGGGNFEMVLPRDFFIEKGAEVHLPGIIPYVVAKVETIISDPRDAFQKALLASPVNIFELKFVEIVQ